VKGKKFKIILGFLLVAIVSLLIMIYYYNKPDVNVVKTNAAYVLTAKNLIEEYRADETSTNKKYTEKVIQVNGMVHEITTLKGNSVITIRNADQESSIICHMLPNQTQKALQLVKGQRISVKGVCTGYLLDVMMVKCILVE
jgi:putative nucleic acid binding protein